MTDIPFPANPTDTTSANLEAEMGYGQLLQILWRRGLWLGGAIAASIGLAAGATMLQTPVYQSEMRLLVEPNVSDSISLNSKDGAETESSQVALDYATQLNLMRSKQFAAYAVKTHPEVCENGVGEAACIDSFYSSLALSQVQEDSTRTRIFEAVFTGEDAAKTQASLAALREVYLNYNEAQQDKRLNDGLALVNKQIDQVQGDLQKSQEALREFRQNGKTIDPQQQSLVAADSLNQVSQARQALAAAYQEAQAKYKAIEQSLSMNPQQALIANKLSQSDRYQSLLNALQTSELALAERLAVYTQADPTAQDLQAQRDRQIALLKQESRRLLGPDASQLVGGQEADLLSNGQLGASSLALVQELIDTQIALSGMAAREDSLVKTQQSLQQDLDIYPELIAQYDRLQPEVETQRASLAELLQTRQALTNDLAQGGFKWAIVEEPDAGRKIAPNPIQNLAMGAVVGLFIGGALAYVREASDTVARTPAQLEKWTALPLLGVLPKFSGKLARSRQVASMETDATLSLVQWEPFREAVDLIYKNIQLAGEPLKSVMVTSAVAGEGKTTLALGLALSAARSQKRVLLIDADLRNPSIGQKMGLSNKRGLTILLASIETPLPVTVSLAGTRLDILTAGPRSDDPVRLLNSHRMIELAAKFEQQYDLIVFDSSAVLGRVDALQIASLCQGVVTVSRLRQATQTNVAQAVSILARVNRLGIVVNDSSNPGPAYLAPPSARKPAYREDEHLDDIFLDDRDREESFLPRRR